MIHLEAVTENNWRENLSVSEDQKSYVSDSMRLLARAYAYREKGSFACVVYQDESPVGMALYYECPEFQAYDFSQLFIDKKYQGCGYGKIAAQLILDRMKAERKYDKVILCYIKGNDVAKTMYESLGFYHTGDADGDEILMEMKLSPATAGSCKI